MARPHDRKRQRTDDVSQDHLPSKRAKSNGLSRRDSNFPPDFYDNLSKIHLTRRALRELDRRNNQQPQPQPEPWVSQEPLSDFAQVIRKGGAQLARFARAGGPDLLDLRGCQDVTHAMASASPSAPSRRTQSTKPTTASSKSKRSSAYDANFELHLIKHNIFPLLYDFPDDRLPPEPTNLDEILQALKVPRRSLSPSVIPKSAFRDFQRKNTTKSEGTMMRNVIPVLAGALNIPNEGHLPFVNLDSITANTTANPVPDFFDGAHPSAVDIQVKEDLDNIIIPTKHAKVPIAPNFFLEAKGPGGSGDVARAQATLNGAYGARMMHALQNYLEEPIYDDNAYTFTSTLLDGTLKLYAHHISAPAKHHISTPANSRQGPEYHITQLKAYALTGDTEVWLEGTGAFRNLRKLAKDYRDRFIKSANEKAYNRNTAAVATEDSPSIVGDSEETSSSPLDFFDCQLFAEIQEEDDEQQEASAGLGILDPTQNKDDRDADLSQPDTEVSTGFATSFASSFSTEIGRTDQMRPQQPKLPRSPPSPSSVRHSKKRAPPKSG